MSSLAEAPGEIPPLDALGLRLIELRNTRYDPSRIPAQRQAERKLIDAIYAAAGRDNPLAESPTDTQIDAGVQPALRLVAASRPANARRTPLPDDDPRSKAKVVLHAEKREWLIGEPVVLHFEVRNEGELPVSVNFGGDYRGAGGRSLRFKVLAIDAQGRVADDPLPSRMHMGGFVGGITVEASDSSWRDIPLWRSCVIQEPGDYTVRVYHDLGWDDRSFDYEQAHTPIAAHLAPEAEIDLTFRLPTEAETHQVVQRVLKLPASPDIRFGERAGAYGDMTAVNHPVYLPTLRDLASEGETKCLTAIRSIPSVDATRSLIELSRHTSPAVREAATRQLLQRLPRHGSSSFRLHWPSEYPWEEELVEPTLEIAWRLLDGDRDKQIRGARILAACGRPDDSTHYLEAYDRLLIEHRDNPKEQDPFPAPRQACGSMRSAGLAMLDRGATPPEQPATLAEKLLVAEMIKRDDKFRPAGWQDLFTNLLEHQIGFVRLAALDCLPPTEARRRHHLVHERLFDAKMPVRVRAINLAKQLELPELGEPLAKVLRDARDQWLIRSAHVAALTCGVSRSRLMEICLDNLGKVGTAPGARPYESDPFFDLLIDSLERAGGSGGSQVDWSRTRDVRAAWLALLEANRERLDAGELIPLDHPLVTTALFPKGFHIHRDGRSWPDWKAVE